MNENILIKLEIFFTREESFETQLKIASYTIKGTKSNRDIKFTDVNKFQVQCETIIFISLQKRKRH